PMSVQELIISQKETRLTNKDSMKWQFADPPNVAVFTSKNIINQTEWIQYVSHDEDDGAWQFHSAGGASDKDISIVSLEEITEMDPSVILLSDLPAGWFASRTTKEGAWKREKKV